MVTLLEGTQAPDLTAKSTDGLGYSLYQSLRESHVVLLAFFKVSCPVCQFEFPYLERLHRGYPKIPIWAVSQDDLDATVAFRRMYGITFPTLLDQHLSSTVEYGLTNVPSVFLIGNDKKVRQAIFGFDKVELEKLNLELAMIAGVSSKPLFSSADEVPLLRPG
jgi:peroxiredoxin